MVVILPYEDAEAAADAELAGTPFQRAVEPVANHEEVCSARLLAVRRLIRSMQVLDMGKKRSEDIRSLVAEVVRLEYGTKQ